MSDQPNPKAALGALLTPDNCVLVLIDHQPFQFAGLRSHDTQTIINNVVGLAKSAKVFGVPTLLSSVVEERGGYILKASGPLPEQKPIDRTFINAWEDERVVEWVSRPGRTKIVMAALWTEICLAMPGDSGGREGYEVYAVTDASGGVSLEAHDGDPANDPGWRDADHVGRLRGRASARLGPRGHCPRDRAEPHRALGKRRDQPPVGVAVARLGRRVPSLAPGRRRGRASPQLAGV